MTRLGQLSFIFFIFYFVCCTPVRTQDPTAKPNVYISVNVKKNNESTFSELPVKDSVVVGVNADDYRTVLLKYKELDKIISAGISWSLGTTEGSSVDIVGLSFGISEDGYLITINESIFVPFAEKKDFNVIVKRATTVLSVLTLSVSKYIPPTLKTITLTRKSSELTSNANIGQTIDLSTLFDYTILPERAQVNSFVWLVQNDVGTIAEGTSLFTAVKEGVANIAVRSDAKPIVTSAAASLQCVYSNKTLKLKNVFFSVVSLPADKQLVAWHQYTSSAEAPIYLNLGLLNLNKVDDPTSSIKAEVTSNDYVISSKVLAERDSKFLITIETVANDPVFVAAIVTPSKAVIFSEAINNVNTTLPLNFLGSAEFSQAGKDGKLSTLTAFTPSDNPASNNNDFKGIWFVKDNMPSRAGLQPTSSLNLPVLPTSGEWIYEGWLIKSNTDGNSVNISLGKFFDPSKPDTSKYYYTGSSVPAYPGEDLLVNRSQGQVGFLSPNPFAMMDVRSYKVAIILEKSSDLSREDLIPGYLKILETSVSTIGIDSPQQFGSILIPSAMLEIKN